MFNMKALRTPDERFKNLKGFAFEPKYKEVPDGEGGRLRIHYIDEGSQTADPVLLIHGEPSWSYLYRKMVPILVDAGNRVVVPDLVGFGRSDKPAGRSDYTFQRHVDWMQAWLDQVDLKRITFVGQDWGGLIGLRLVANQPERFARVVVANTGLPTGDGQISEAFLAWRNFSVEVPDFNLGQIIAMGCKNSLTEEVIAAYNAPFPDDTFKEGARIFPSLVPITPDDPASVANREAWKVLEKFAKPFLTAFSDGDPITGGGDRIFLEKVPGTKGQPHTTIKGGGHFLQEDCGEDFARVIADFIKKA
jgi:haloalkane dehalogenase